MDNRLLQPVRYANVLMKFGDTTYGAETTCVEEHGAYRMVFKPYHGGELVGTDKEFISVDFTTLEFSGDNRSSTVLKDTYSIFFGDFHKTKANANWEDADGEPTVTITYRSHAYKNYLLVRDAVVVVVMDCHVELGSEEMIIRLPDGYELFRYDAQGMVFNPAKRLFLRTDFPNYFTYGYDGDKTDGAIDYFGNYKTPSVILSDAWFRSDEEVGGLHIHEDTLLLFPRLDTSQLDFGDDIRRLKDGKEVTLFNNVRVVDKRNIQRYLHRIVLNADVEIEETENERVFSVYGRQIRVDNRQGSVVYWEKAIEAFAHADMIIEKTSPYNRILCGQISSEAGATSGSCYENNRSSCCDNTPSCCSAQEPRGAEITN